MPKKILQRYISVLASAAFLPVLCVILIFLTEFSGNCLGEPEMQCGNFNCFYFVDDRAVCVMRIGRR